MNKIQSIIKKSPKKFAERFKVPLSTVRKWSSGASKPPKYVVELIENEINNSR